MTKPVSRRKEKRVHMLMWAMLHHGRRELQYRYLAWIYLLEWARLGGTPDEVPHD